MDSIREINQTQNNDAHTLETQQCAVGKQKKKGAKHKAKKVVTQFKSAITRAGHSLFGSTSTSSSRRKTRDVSSCSASDHVNVLQQFNEGSIHCQNAFGEQDAHLSKARDENVAGDCHLSLPLPPPLTQLHARRRYGRDTDYASPSHPFELSRSHIERRQQNSWNVFGLVDTPEGCLTHPEVLIFGENPGHLSDGSDIPVVTRSPAVGGSAAPHSSAQTLNAQLHLCQSPPPPPPVSPPPVVLARHSPNSRAAALQSFPNLTSPACRQPALPQPYLSMLAASSWHSGVLHGQVSWPRALDPCFVEYHAYSEQDGGSLRSCASLGIDTLSKDVCASDETAAAATADDHHLSERAAAASTGKATKASPDEASLTYPVRLLTLSSDNAQIESDEGTAEFEVVADNVVFAPSCEDTEKLLASLCLRSCCTAAKMDASCQTEDIVEELQALSSVAHTHSQISSSEKKHTAAKSRENHETQESSVSACSCALAARSHSNFVHSVGDDVLPNKDDIQSHERSDMSSTMAHTDQLRHSDKDMQSAMDVLSETVPESSNQRRSDDIEPERSDDNCEIDAVGGGGGGDDDIEMDNGNDDCERGWQWLRSICVPAAFSPSAARLGRRWHPAPIARCGAAEVQRLQRELAGLLSREFGGSALSCPRVPPVLNASEYEYVYSDVDQDYVRLGWGARRSVYLGRHVPSGELVAIKTLPKTAEAADSDASIAAALGEAIAYEYLLGVKQVPRRHGLLLLRGGSGVVNGMNNCWALVTSFVSSGERGRPYRNLDLYSLMCRRGIAWPQPHRRDTAMAAAAAETDDTASPPRGDSLIDADTATSDAVEPADWYFVCRRLAEAVARVHRRGVVIGELNEDSFVVRREPNGSWHPFLVSLGRASRRSGALGGGRSSAAAAATSPLAGGDSWPTVLPPSRVASAAAALRDYPHVAPEVVRGEPPTTKSDMYGLAVLLRKIGRLARLPQLSNGVWACLSPEPNRRCTAHELWTEMEARIGEDARTPAAEPSE